MSTSIIFLNQNFNANDVEIMVFEPSVLFLPPQFRGEINDMVHLFLKQRFSNWLFLRIEMK